MSNIQNLLFVGGASGVGKSTVLKALSTHPQLNTGDFFKAAMKIADRDAIKSVNWVDYQDTVADLLMQNISNASEKNKLMIIDTHFSAKAHNKSYRIGLRKELIYKIGGHAFRQAESRGHTLNVIVALIFCNPYELLERRRLDTGRKRELFPADCVRALSENSRCSVFYLSEVARARSEITSDLLHSVRFLRIENMDLRKARRNLLNITGEKNDDI
jgi:adenylate kinase